MLDLFDRPGQQIKKDWIEKTSMAHHPESQLSNHLIRRSFTELLIRLGAGWGFSIVAFERDGVPRDIRQIAPGAWFVVDVYPKMGSSAEVVTHLSLHLILSGEGLALQCGRRPTRDIIVEVVTLDHCFPDALLGD